MANPLIEAAVETAERERDHHAYAKLIRAAEEENADTVQQIMSCEIEDESTRNSVRGKALVLSATKGQINIVNLLLHCKVNVEFEDDGGYPALGWAASKGHMKIVQLLLDAGANIDTQGRWQQDDTPLISAVRSGHHEVVQVLLDRGAVTEVSGVLQRTALHWAAARGLGDIAESLIRAGAKIQALILACMHGCEGVVRILLQRETSIHPNVVDADTTVTWAAEKEEELGANSRGRANIDCDDVKGRTALYFAAKFGFYNIVDMCLNHGANAESTDQHEVTILMAAVHGCSPAIVARLRSDGVDINVKDSKGRTALCLAVQNLTRENKERTRQIINILDNDVFEPQSNTNDCRKACLVTRRFASGASNLVAFLAILATIHTTCQLLRYHRDIQIPRYLRLLLYKAFSRLLTFSHILPHQPSGCRLPISKNSFSNPLPGDVHSEQY